MPDGWAWLNVHMCMPSRVPAVWREAQIAGAGGQVEEGVAWSRVLHRLHSCCLAAGS